MWRRNNQNVETIRSHANFCSTTTIHGNVSYFRLTINHRLGKLGSCRARGLFWYGSREYDVRTEQMIWLECAGGQQKFAFDSVYRNLRKRSISFEKKIDYRCLPFRIRTHIAWPNREVECRVTVRQSRSARRLYIAACAEYAKKRRRVREGRIGREWGLLADRGRQKSASPVRLPWGLNDKWIWPGWLKAQWNTKESLSNDVRAQEQNHTAIVCLWEEIVLLLFEYLRRA